MTRLTPMRDERNSPYVYSAHIDYFLPKVNRSVPMREDDFGKRLVCVGKRSKCFCRLQVLGPVVLVVELIGQRYTDNCKRIGLTC